jgi:hypothetical protein
MNCVLSVSTPPTFVTVDGVWGSVAYIWQYLNRDQVDTPELRSNREILIKTARISELSPAQLAGSSEYVKSQFWRRRCAPG